MRTSYLSFISGTQPGIGNPYKLSSMRLAGSVCLSQVLTEGSWKYKLSFPFSFFFFFILFLPFKYQPEWKYAFLVGVLWGSLTLSLKLPSPPRSCLWAICLISMPNLKDTVFPPLLLQGAAEIFSLPALFVLFFF